MLNAYIAFEGLDHAGKTTQAQALFRQIRQQYDRVVYMKCGGLGGQTKQLQSLRDKARSDSSLSPEARNRIFMLTARLQNKELATHLVDHVVIGDRSVWSLEVWSKVHGRRLLASARSFIRPGLVIYLCVDPEVAWQRIMADAEASFADRSHTIDTLLRSKHVYDEMARSQPEWQTIDGSASIEAVQVQVTVLCDSFLGTTTGGIDND